MLSIQKITGNTIGALLIFLVFAIPVMAQPMGPRDHGPAPDMRPQRGGRPDIGFHFPTLPEQVLSLVVEGIKYFYFDGVYYVRSGVEYVVVVPPVGAVVEVLPAEYEPVIISGVTYYSSNGSYYVYTPRGYQVVPKPVVVVQTAPLTTTVVAAQSVVTASPSAAEESFTVNIPNDKGSYTPVVIKRVKDGFVGPQGESYSEFPRVAQLQVMYGAQGK